MTKGTYTLGIDYGSQHIGIALIRHTDKNPNEPLYAGTFHVDTGGQEGLPTKVNDRKTARRMRRTQDSKKRRLRLLRDALTSIGIKNSTVTHIVSFSRRRGHKWEQKEKRFDKKAKKEYFQFSGGRQEFLQALDNEIAKLIPDDKKEQVFETCKEILDKAPSEDIRPSRFLNRNPSKCRWKDCKNNVPAARNAIDARLSQSFYVKFIPLIDSLNDRERQGFCEKLDSYINDFVSLASGYKRLADVEIPDKDEEKKLGKEYSKEKASFKKYLLSLKNHLDKEFADDLNRKYQEYYGKELDNIVKKQQSGRMSFCREHSDVYIQYLLSHKEIPYKDTIEERDIKSRQQQILFSKIWRFIVARLLPLTDGWIDRVSVERNAFDLLAIPFDDKMKLSEEKANQLYWQGPKYGYNNDTKKMLFAEFDGYCCYCGNKFSENEFAEVEHVLPRSKFGFDNYFNLVLACTGCNSRKGNNTGLEFKPIHPNAYNAYSKYVDDRGTRKLRHVFHTIKKGILNLLTNGNAKAETQLSIIGQNLLEATTTQKGPRPLARFLSQRIRNVCGKAPEIKLVNGRHTAVYRRLILPDFDKLAEKLDADKETAINHAIDAMLIAFQVPPYAWHEKGFHDYKDYEYWAGRIKNSAPNKDVEGLPEFSPPEPIIGFEKPSTANSRFYSIDILSTAWNREHSATHKLEPVGMSKEGQPIKKEPASEVVKKILKMKPTKKKSVRENVEAYIGAISQPALRETLLKALSEKFFQEAVAQKLVEWLKRTITGAIKGKEKEGSKEKPFSNHPSSLERKKHLEKFLTADTKMIIDSPQEFIPPNISIRMALDIKGQVDLKRMDKKTGEIMHHYMCQPAVKMKIVAYKANEEGNINRQKCKVFDVRQNWQVLEDSSRYKIVDDEKHVLNGRVLSNGIKEEDFLKEWEAELNKYLGSRFKEWHRITQGNYLEYETGEGFFIRNFKDIKLKRFKSVVKVWRSPYKWLANRDKA